MRLQQQAFRENDVIKNVMLSYASDSKRMKILHLSTIFFAMHRETLKGGNWGIFASLDFHLIYVCQLN